MEFYYPICEFSQSEILDLVEHAKSSGMSADLSVAEIVKPFANDALKTCKSFDKLLKDLSKGVAPENAPLSDYCCVFADCLKRYASHVEKIHKACQDMNNKD